MTSTKATNKIKSTRPARPDTAKVSELPVTFSLSAAPATFGKRTGGKPKEYPKAYHDAVEQSYNGGGKNSKALSLTLPTAPQAHAVRIAIVYIAKQKGYSAHAEVEDNIVTFVVRSKRVYKKNTA